MPSTLPPKFVDITSARVSQGYLHVIGVVVDVLAKSRSGGSSFVTTFTIKDSDIDGNPMEGLKVKYFNDDEALLPELQLHDVILLRNIRMRLFRGNLLGVASQHDKIPWTIFRRNSGLQTDVAQIRGPNSIEPSPEEKAYANSLLNSISSGGLLRSAPAQSYRNNHSVIVSASRSVPSLPISRDRFSLIKDVKPHTFADLVVEVVKTFPEYDKYLLYVTDYTSNESLFNYEPPSGDNGGDDYDFTSRRRKQWQGPFGQMTLQLTLWEPHSYFARQNVKENDFVFLSNVHIKLDRHSARVDGSIHTDRLHPDKVRVSIIDDDDDVRLQELVRRKREYWRKAKVAVQLGNKNDGNKGSKNAAKKKREQPKKEVRREEGQIEITTSIQTKRNEPNPYIRALNPAVPCRLLADILDNDMHCNSLPGGIEYHLPFQNLCYRATVRVVDFFPPKLEDFAVSYNPEYDMLSGSESDSEHDDGDATFASSYPGHRQAWEWRFCLLVENGVPTPRGQPKERMKLYVSGNDAVYLLKIDATDLRKNEYSLRQLRERLFILWGDLEEKKNCDPHGKLDPKSMETPSGKPFTCCIKEYGVRCTEKRNPDAMTDEDHDCGLENCLGWERRFAMFGTTIND